MEELSGQVEGGGAAEDGHHTPIIPRNSDSNGEKSYAVSPKMDEGTKGLISEAMESQTGKQFGRLVVDEGKRQYVPNAFWTILRKEVEDIQGVLSEVLFEGSESLVPESTLAAAVENQDHRSFILGYGSLQVSLRPLHPLPSQISFYWQMYIENVDPIVQIMHKLTMGEYHQRSQE